MGMEIKISKMVDKGWTSYFTHLIKYGSIMKIKIKKKMNFVQLDVFQLL